MGSKQQVPDGMLIGPKNPIIEEALGDRLIGGKREAAELSVADFDGSRWKLVCTPDQPNVATVHLDVGGWSEIEKVGGRDVLESLYAGIVGAKQEGFVGYVSLTVFARHVDSTEKLAKKVDLCLAFRHYLHYHIKAAKTNLHMRMRRKVRGWLQVLNRATLSSEAPKEKKTISGRTFTRK